MQYLIAFLEGIITFISPCLLPMLPIYISYFAGGGERTTRKTLTGALGFVTGFTLIFVAMGALAGSLAINPNTIQKAYEALEAEGYVYSVPGKGSFAAPHNGVDTRRREQLLEQMDALVKELAYLGMSPQDICGYIQEKEVETHD